MSNWRQKQSEVEGAAAQEMQENRFQGAGIFLRPAAATAGISSSSSAIDPTAATTTTDNYALGVDNNTFIPLLKRLAGDSTPQPLLLQLTSNISWGNHPDMPLEGLDVSRPVYIVGRHGVKAGVDLGMKADMVSLTGGWSNMTLDNVVVENMATGTLKSVQNFNGITLANTLNCWFFLWDR